MTHRNNTCFSITGLESGLDGFGWGPHGLMNITHIGSQFTNELKQLVDCLGLVLYNFTQALDRVNYFIDTVETLSSCDVDVVQIESSFDLYSHTHEFVMTSSHQR